MTEYSLMYNTIKLYLKKSNNIEETATGFFYKKNDRIYIVTNKHVVSDIEEITFILHQSFEVPAKIRSFSIGGYDIGRIIKVHNNCDLAIIDITNFVFEDDKYTMLSSRDIINESELTFDTVMKNVYIIGYPIGIEDELNKLPTFSTGITSSSLLIDYNGKSEILLNAFALPGSSGSPVFTNNNGKRKLIGVISAGKVYSDGKPISNLCIAIKAKEIDNII